MCFECESSRFHCDSKSFHVILMCSTESAWSLYFIPKDPVDFLKIQLIPSDLDDVI